MGRPHEDAHRAVRTLPLIIQVIAACRPSRPASVNLRDLNAAGSGRCNEAGS